jgi:hypothetical protein
MRVLKSLYENNSKKKVTYGMKAFMCLEELIVLLLI